MVALLVLNGCAASHRSPYDRYYQGSGAYRPPGPRQDPWGPYIRSAADRFSLPEEWIRAVIHQESGGHAFRNGRPITSRTGAMGLMQLMPQTYADMQHRFHLRSDPYEPHDNIMAGTGYLHILYEKYGAPAFLAAYNAGPAQLEAYLYRHRRLPKETVSYVAAITPHLGTKIAMTGPLAVYATRAQRHGGRHGNKSVMVARNEPPASQPIGPPSSSGRALSRPVSSARHEAAYTVPQTHLAPPASSRSAPAEDLELTPVAPPAANYGTWSVQVGAFANSGQAHFAAIMARQAAYDSLQAAQIVVQSTRTANGRLWRARLAGISRSAAAKSCSALARQEMPCIAVPPGR